VIPNLTGYTYPLRREGGRLYRMDSRGPMLAKVEALVFCKIRQNTSIRAESLRQTKAYVRDVAPPQLAGSQLTQRCWRLHI
jgi:hypothetical protein